MPSWLGAGGPGRYCGPAAPVTRGRPGPSTSPLGAMSTATRRIHAAIATVALLLCARPVPAPIVGEFPGLSNLIAASENIVVALVVSGPDEVRLTTFNAAQPQKVRVLYALKGTLQPQDEAKVTLSTLDVLGGGEFDVGERYLLFLRSYNSAIRLVNVRGSAFRVPATTDLAKLRSGDVRASIGLLLQDLVTQTKGPNAALLEKEAADYLQSP
jgi:hypothetical protein